MCRQGRIKEHCRQDRVQAASPVPNAPTSRRPPPRPRHRLLPACRSRHRRTLRTGTAPGCAPPLGAVHARFCHATAATDQCPPQPPRTKRQHRGQGGSPAGGVARRGINSSPYSRKRNLVGGCRPAAASAAVGQRNRPSVYVEGAGPAAWHDTDAWQGRWRRPDGQRGGIGERSGWWGGAEEGLRAVTVAEWRDAMAMTTTPPWALGNDSVLGRASDGCWFDPVWAVLSTIFRYADAGTGCRGRRNLRR